jgi:hypothetical protein
MSCVNEKTGLEGLVINLEESYELRDWMKAFECTEQQLSQAMAAAGNSADDVRDYLDSDREPRHRPTPARPTRAPRFIACADSLEKSIVTDRCLIVS